MQIDCAAATRWMQRHVAPLAVDLSALRANLLGSRWFMLGEAGPRCEHVLRELYENLPYRHFISGGALGMDMFAAEAVVELRKQHPEVILEMVSPFDDQASKWPEEYRARHDLLFELADITTATSHIYTKSAMFIRNRYLVNNADLLLAAYDGQPGGTAMTIGYAKANGVTVQIIRPVLSAA